MTLTKHVLFLSAVLLFSAVPLFATGASYEIEPDDYPDGTVLNFIHPRVDLAIHDGFQTPVFPKDFGVFPDPHVIPVTAWTNEDTLGGYFTSTGTKAFAHAGVRFTPLSRAIGMRFNGLAKELSIDAIGSDNHNATVGVLEVYDAGGNLLESVSSSELLRQQVETLTITRPGFDIGFARAYSSNDYSPFGRFDYLRFSSVPEPATLSLLALGGCVCLTSLFPLFRS